MWVSVARILLPAVTIAVVLYALFETGWWGGFLLVPVAIAIALVVALRHPPFVALFTDALATVGVIAVPMIAYEAASGDLDTRGPIVMASARALLAEFSL
ncbi:MAG: hypothetical protein WD904_13040 [Dehalococcoidia bacterium]